MVQRLKCWEGVSWGECNGDIAIQRPDRHAECAECERAEMTPDPAAVREQLEKILASDNWTSAGRHSRLLRYLVERTVAGEGDQLKEYVLGIEVFDRSDAYDPRLDSIVRVEVRRLRGRLDDYYQGTGAADPVLITVPRGSYVPVFESRAHGAASVDGNSSVVRREQRRSYSPAAIIAAGLSIVIVLFATGVALNHNRGPAQASTGPSIAVLPFEHYSTNEADAMLVARLTDAVTTELARLGTVSVASRTSAAQYTGGPYSVVEIAEALRVDLVIEASAEVTASGMRVVARLVDGRSDRKVWVGEYDVPRDEVAAAARRLANESAVASIKYLNR